jgi:hypothetical protein
MMKKLAIAGFLASLLVAGYFANYGIRTTRPASLRRRIEQNIKMGSTPDEVLKFLDDQHLDHTPLTRTVKYSNLRNSYGDVPMIGAIKRRTWRSLLTYENIQIVFVFDGNKRLVRFDLIPVYTGL